MLGVSVLGVCECECVLGACAGVRARAGRGPQGEGAPLPPCSSLADGGAGPTSQAGLGSVRRLRGGLSTRPSCRARVPASAATVLPHYASCLKRPASPRLRLSQEGSKEGPATSR